MKTDWQAYAGSGKFLKKEDVLEPVDTELLWVKEEQVTTPEKGTRTRLVASFEGLAKGLPLNATNCKVLTEISGTRDPNLWKDIPVNLFWDADVDFKGQRSGGIRLRKQVQWSPHY
jgi:hypothetical protein